MSKKTRKSENEAAENAMEIETIKPKKQKHNSKRRRCKKKQITFEPNSESTLSKVDEVVNFLCKTIAKNEYESDVNSPANLTKESTKNLEVCAGQNHNRNAMHNCSKSLASTSAADLSNLFENLQVRASNNPIQSYNITEFLNIDLLKKTNCESLSVEDVEKPKQEKAKNTSLEQKDFISDENLKEYFNLNLIQKCPRKSVIEQIDSGSKRLVSELERSFHSSVCEAEDNPKKNKFLTEYFNVGALMQTEDNFVTSIKSTSKLLVNQLEKTLLKGDTPEKGKNSQKNQNGKQNANEFPEEADIFGANQEVPDFQEKKESAGSRISGSPQSNKKRQHSSKNSSFNSKKETKFPKHLSAEELLLLSNLGVLLSGIIRINQRNYKDAYITAPDKGMDILIEGLKDRNRALEGDEVYFVLKPKEYYRMSVDSSDIQRTAVVVGIKSKNHNRGAIGTLNPIKKKNIHVAMFSPRDSRLPRIRIKKSNWPVGFSKNSNDFTNRLYFAKILHWEDLRFAEGELLTEVGLVGDVEAETTALLLKYDLDTTPYSKDMTQVMPPTTFKIPQTEIHNREDFRKECVFTIDPELAVDLDDAISCKRLPNGNYEVGVHISDVSYFLKEGTALDKAVCKRATTIYLVQRAYHMLPYELCRLCSLTPGEDKLSFSVIWLITPQCQILGHRFARTIMNSCAQLSYDQAQSVINGSSDSVFPKIHGGHSIENIKEIILFLHKLTANLRDRRFGNGALRIDQKKILFSLDENLLPVDFRVEVHEESHQLIEELMLLANITVAERLFDCFPKVAFLRSHSPPLPFVLEKLQKNLEKYGIILDISSSGSLHSSLVKYSGDDTESVARMLVLSNVVAKPMARAKYYCSSVYLNEEERRHYALNVPLYTHFTSPIRRYADIMTHRLLAASMGYCDPPRWTVDQVQSIASNCNKQKYAAKMAGDLSTELYLSIYIGLKGIVVCEAVVCDIKNKSFDCIVLSTGAHQRLYFEHIMGVCSQQKEDGIMRLIVKWPKDENHQQETRQVIEMFSIVKIQLKQVTILKIEAQLLRCE